jgi:REP element-mobilizing transposase RayT
MKYDSAIHHRRSIRLKGYDYSRCGAYFITLCTQERLCLFGDIVDGVMVFNDAGRMIYRTFEEMPTKYPGIQIDMFVVMPNHLHGVIIIENEICVGAAPRGRPLSLSNKPNSCLTEDIDKGQMVNNRKQYERQPRQGQPREGQPRGVAPTEDGRMSLSDIVHRFKSFTTHLYSNGVKEHKWAPFPGRLWQRNYYERIIRGENEFSKIREYIETNPYAWDEDEDNPYKTGNNHQSIIFTRRGKPRQ